MENRNASRLCADSHVTFRIVDAVDDIAVFQIVHHLFHRHFGTVIFGFFRGSAEMRNHDTSFFSRRYRIGEIGYIFTDFSSGDPFQNGLLVYQQISRKI